MVSGSPNPLLGSFSLYWSCWPPLSGAPLPRGNEGEGRCSPVLMTCRLAPPTGLPTRERGPFPQTSLQALNSSSLKTSSFRSRGVTDKGEWAVCLARGQAVEDWGWAESSCLWGFEQRCRGGGGGRGSRLTGQAMHWGGGGGHRARTTQVTALSGALGPCSRPPPPGGSPASPSLRPSPPGPLFHPWHFAEIRLEEEFIAGLCPGTTVTTLCLSSGAEAVSRAPGGQGCWWQTAHGRRQGPQSCGTGGHPRWAPGCESRAARRRRGPAWCLRSGGGGGKSGSARSLGATTLATCSLDTAKASPALPSPHPAFAPLAPSTQTCGSAGFRPPSRAGAALALLRCGAEPAPCPRKFPSTGGAWEWSHRLGARPCPPRPARETGLGTREGGLGAGVPGRVTPPGSPPQPPPPSYGRESAPHRAGEGPPTCLSAPTSQAHLAACVPGYLTPLSLRPCQPLCPVWARVCGIVNMTCAQRVLGFWG